VNRVTSEIAKEICVFFQHYYRHAGSREQIPRHDPGRPAADDHTSSLHRLKHEYMDSTDHAYLMMSLY
jgi:hypothetical protein